MLIPLEELELLTDDASRVETASNNPWVSAGVRGKPDGCKSCLYRGIGQGFCPDDVPAEPIVGILLEAPGGDEALEQRPMVGRAGQFWERRIINRLGYKREDVAIFNTIRCRPPNNEYPTGQIRTHAEQLCRQYDGVQGINGKLVPGGVRKFNPNLFIATFHPAATFRTPAIYRLILKDMEKAFRFGTSGKGYRPLVLMGDKALSLVAPWTEGKGGLRKWRSHWWHGSWPFGDDSNKKGFREI